MNYRGRIRAVHKAQRALMELEGCHRDPIQLPKVLHRFATDELRQPNFVPDTLGLQCEVRAQARRAWTVEVKSAAA